MFAFVDADLRSIIPLRAPGRVIDLRAITRDVPFDRTSIGRLLCGDFPSFCAVDPRGLEACLPKTEALLACSVFGADKAIGVLPISQGQAAFDQPG